MRLRQYSERPSGPPDGQPCYAVAINARWKYLCTTSIASNRVQNAPTYATVSRRSNRYRGARCTSTDIWTVCSGGTNLCCPSSSIARATHWQNAQSPQRLTTAIMTSQPSYSQKKTWLLSYGVPKSQAISLRTYVSTRAKKWHEGI